MTQDTKQKVEDKGQQRVASQLEDGDELQFEVSEAHQSGPEFVGGKKGFQGVPGDDLGVQSPAELLESAAARKTRSAVDPEDRLELSQDFGGETIEGFTSNSGEVHPQPQKTQAAAPAVSEPAAPRPTETSKIRQLSEAELKKIEQNLYGNSPNLTEKERAEIAARLNKVRENIAGGSRQSASSATHAASPVATKPADILKHVDDTSDVLNQNATRRARGVAYFYKNWVEIVSSHPLQADDEIVMGERAFVLRPKRLSSQTKLTLYGVLGGLVIALTAIAMVGGNGVGAGSIAGMVLDTNGLPYIQGAVIQISEAGVRGESNGIGMFRLDGVPKGSHKIDIVVGGKTVGSDFATATDDELTLTVVKFAAAHPIQDPIESSTTSDQPTSGQNPPEESPAVNSAKVTKQPAVQSESFNKSAITSTNSAKIALNTNVADAKFSLDGKTLGAGNTTFGSLTPGEHKYQVSRDGYKSSFGTVKLVAGQTKTLEVQLEPDRSSSKQANTETLHFESGGARMQSGDYNAAIAEYTKAVDAKPSYADAYMMRAEAYRAITDPRSAHDDYVRAAEIYRFRRDPSNAQSAFAKAIEVDSRSITAHLGRADLFLSQGQEIAALADYEVVVRLDKRNFEAHFGLGRCRFDQGNYKQAERHFKDARDIDRKNPASYEYLMLCYMQMDEIKDLRKTWDQFKSVATEENLAKLRADSRFAAAIRAAETR